MGRKSLRDERRSELTGAFARVLATRGYAGATIAAVAREAGVAPGLVHHYFEDKHDLLESLLGDLMDRFRKRARRFEDEEEPLEAYLSAALALDGTADTVAARCWVGVLAEAVRDPALFARVRRLLDGEVGAIQRRAGGRLRVEDANALLAFVLGALMFGALAPRKASGFAAPAARAFVRALAKGAPVGG